MSIFYENFSKLCELKGVSLAEAADACGISRGIIYKWRERNSVPNTATRLAIAGYFNVPVEMLSQWGAFDEGLPEKPADAPLEWAQDEVEAGVAPKDAQAILGHSSIDVTMDVYTEIRADRAHAQKATLDAFFSP